MGHSRARALVVITSLLAAFGTIGTTSATAAAPSQESAAAPSEFRYTTLVAGKRNILGMNVKPTAKLTDTLTGAPLAGQVVLFYLPGNQMLPHMCGGVTNAAGVATCGGVREQFYVLQYRGYDAQFHGKDVGDVYYRGSGDTVGLFGQ